MEKYLDKITPLVSDTWRTDERFLKVKGNTKYLYALMDDQTRFWIAQEVADTKFTADLRPLFRQGKRIAEKKPMTLVTDVPPTFMKHTYGSSTQRGWEREPNTLEKLRWMECDTITRWNA
jgi:transposase-like protein